MHCKPCAKIINEDLAGDTKKCSHQSPDLFSVVQWHPQGTLSTGDDIRSPGGQIADIFSGADGAGGSR